MWIEKVFNDVDKIKSYDHFLNDNVLLINADCKEIIPLINNDSIDCCITDPPYNIADETKYSKNGNNIISNRNNWGYLYQDFWENQDDYWNWLLNITLELKNKVKYHYVYFLDRTFIGHFNYLIKDYFIIKNLFAFIKTNPVPHFRKNNFRSSFELSVWFSNNFRKINFISQNYMKNVFEGPIGNKDKNIEHPNYKYDWMVEPFVLTLFKNNDIVIDLFMGSGSFIYNTLKINKTIKFIGIEKNKVFFDRTKVYIQDFLSQKVLF